MTDDTITTGNTNAHVLVCSCDDTMEIDTTILTNAMSGLRGTSDEIPLYRQLCRSQIAGFEAAIESGQPVMVACTQEAPLFAEIAEEKGRAEPVFANIRERAGWCENKSGSTAKMAALLADALHDNTPAELLALTSQGICLVYGPGQLALDTAAKLANRLSVTVLLSDPDDAIPPDTADIPVYKGRITRAKGALGSFEVNVDGYAPMVPSSRDTLDFMMERDGAASKCDIIIDLSGQPPLFAEAERHDGYFHVDPARPGELADALLTATDLVGEFEKPLYVRYDASVCAHGRSGKVGCNNCVDNCPVSAIEPAGETVEINPLICGGCGSCSASCPTGAVSYAFPGRADILTRAQNLIKTFTEAGGKHPVILFHDGNHGAPLIAAMARFGRGLPINVLPISLYTATQLGHETIAGVLASGAEHVAILAPNTRRDELTALTEQVGLTNGVLTALGCKDTRAHQIVEDDPDAVQDALYALPALSGIAISAFTATPSKRETAKLAFAKLHDASPDAPEVIALPENAPYGQIKIDSENCTLCLACVSCCPANALADNPDRPQVSFTESACVQCGLCAKTCPESVITLEPRYNFAAAAMSPVIKHEEEPFNCISCGNPFGTRSTIEHIMATLSGKHAMFQNSEQAKIIQMCDDCRVIAMSNADNPMAVGEKPRVITTDDYIKAEAEDAPSKKPDDLLS